MNPHDRLRIVLAAARQFWWAFSYLMQVHENHYTKRAGVAGIRARGGTKFSCGWALLNKSDFG
ncbi:hypothetical protein ABLV10_21235 [Klebsiella sp. GG_Kp141]|uniref:hypothetical protein n=1 Tax=Klebsiella sp. GG_Kp141 TaxID=3153452 RepID=UPI0032B52C4D